MRRSKMRRSMRDLRVAMKSRAGPSVSSRRAGSKESLLACRNTRCKPQIKGGRGIKW